MQQNYGFGAACYNKLVNALPLKFEFKMSSPMKTVYTYRSIELLDFYYLFDTIANMFYFASFFFCQSL